MDSYHTLHLLSMLSGMLLSTVFKKRAEMFNGCYEVSNLILFSSVGWLFRFLYLASCHQTQQIPSTG